LKCHKKQPSKTNNDNCQKLTMPGVLPQAIDRRLEIATPVSEQELEQAFASSSDMLSAACQR
jgi:hypothetical protein